MHAFFLIERVKEHRDDAFKFAVRILQSLYYTRTSMILLDARFLVPFVCIVNRTPSTNTYVSTSLLDTRECVRISTYECETSLYSRVRVYVKVHSSSSCMHVRIYIHICNIISICVYICVCVSSVHGCLSTDRTRASWTCACASSCWELSVCGAVVIGKSIPDGTNQLA